MKTKLILLLSIGLMIVSCKDGDTASDKPGTEAVAEKKNTIQLSNYSDVNWTSGVGVAYNMLLTDYSKEKVAILKAGKELEFNDGTIIPYIGYEVVGEFIHVKLNESAAQYKAVAQYPNQVIVR